MPSKTVLSDECLTDLWAKAHHMVGGDIFRVSHHIFAVSIIDAVLQSPEIQQLRKDAKRLDSGCIMTHDRDELGVEYMTERRGIDLRAAIDAAMEQKA